MHNRSGELKEYIAAGISKDEFIRRITALLESRAASIPSPAPAPALVDPVQSHVQDAASVPESDSGVLESETPQTHNVPATAVTVPASVPAARDASPTAQEEPKEQKKLDKGKQKEESGHQKPTTSEMNYALMLKKQQQEKRDERARILKKVEDDKILRRKDAAQRKAAAEKSRSNSEEPAAAGSNKPKRKQPKQYAECALQIRLFDGSTIRSRFPSSATLRVDVRPWIDEHQDGNTAYTFKQILTPLLNKNISISDEEQSLQSQGLAPNATLIIVPVPGSITAYDNSANAGVVSKGISAGYGLASWGTGVVTGLFGSLIGGRPAPQQQEEQSGPAPEASTPSSSGINVRTLRDQNRPDEQQFYNGNAVSRAELCQAEKLANFRS